MKDRNMSARPRVLLAILDPDNPFRYVQIRGRVARSTEDGVEAHIDQLACKYLGEDHFPHSSDEVWETYYIQPIHVEVKE
jgi:hypothetical protein